MMAVCMPLGYLRRSTGATPAAHNVPFPHERM
jgi:hypothetical protein